MTQLEKFYKNHFDSSNLMKWEELSDKQKKILESSFAYNQFKLNIALSQFSKSICETFSSRKFKTSFKFPDFKFTPPTPNTMNPDEIYDPMVRFHESNNIHPTAIIYDNVKMGKNNTIRAGAIIGGDGEIRGLGPNDFRGSVEIGDGNSINEYVTIHRPASAAAVTKIGDNNIIMAHSHIGHDVQIGNNCEIASGSIIGGHAIIEDDVKIKLGVTVRNRKTVGKGALVGLGSAVVKDVNREDVVVGNPARPMNGPKMTMKYMDKIEDFPPVPPPPTQSNLDDLNPNA